MCFTTRWRHKQTVEPTGSQLRMPAGMLIPQTKNNVDLRIHPKFFFTKTSHESDNGTWARKIIWVSWWELEIGIEPNGVLILLVLPIFFLFLSQIRWRLQCAIRKGCKSGTGWLRVENESKWLHLPSNTTNVFNGIKGCILSQFSMRMKVGGFRENSSVQLKIEQLSQMLKALWPL